MPYTLQDFYREFTKENLDLLTLEERLEGLSSDDILNALSADDILKILSPEDILKSFSVQELEAYLKKLRESSEIKASA